MGEKPGNTDLLEAGAEDSKMELLNGSKRKNPNPLDSLIDAVDSGCSEDVRKILKKRGLVSQLADFSQCYWRAWKGDNKEICAILLEHRFKVTTEEIREAVSLADLCCNGDIRLLQTKVNQQNCHYRDWEGRTALMWAAIASCRPTERHAECADLLLTYGSDANAADLHGDTALHLSAASGNLPVIEMLLTRGAAADARNLRGAQPIAEADRHSMVEAAMMLRCVELPAAGSVSGELDRTAHSETETSGSDGYQQLLLNPAAAASHVAAETDNLALLSVLPFSVKFARDKRQMTPLMKAVERGSWKCLKHLLHLFRQQRYSGRKSKLLGLRDSLNRTALDIAREFKRAEMAEAILLELQLAVSFKYPCVSGLSFKIQLSSTVEKLMHLAREGDTNGLRSSVTRLNADLPDEWGRTALMRATWSRRANEEALKLLIEAGDPSAADVFGWSCMHWAARYGRLAALRLLAEAGAPVNSRDQAGKTPLMWAAETGRSGAVELLLKIGADPGLLDLEGRDARQWALLNDNADIVDLLERQVQLLPV